LPKWALGVVLAGAALFVGAGAVAFMMFYAKNNPHSGIANVFSKM
jgi:galactokinase/mevalonate kinase-like predicted kinase